MNNLNPTWIKQIKLIAWDLDGTLYPDSPKLHEAIRQEQLKAVADKLGVDIHETEDKFNQIYEQLHSHTKTLDFLGINGQQFFLDVWQKMNLANYIHKNKKLSELLRQIYESNKWQQYLLTNSNNRVSIELKLGLIGIDLEVFDQIFNSVEIGHNKPDIGIFKYLWESSGLNRDEIVYVGDRERTDIQAAKKYGLKAIKIAKNNEKKTEADLVFPTAEQVAELFLQS